MSVHFGDLETNFGKLIFHEKQSFAEILTKEILTKTFKTKSLQLWRKVGKKLF